MGRQELEAFLKTFKNRFEPAIQNYLDATIDRMKAIDSSGGEVARIIRDFSLNGGKRLRGALVTIGYQAFSNRDWTEVLQAAISTELFHTFFLIHDDVMDRSDLRRGSPTVHKVFEMKYRDSNLPMHNVEHLAHSMAILAGDLCCAMAYDALLTMPFSGDRIVRTLKHMQRMVDSTTIGQVLDMTPVEMPTAETIEKIHLLKTARYSVEAPLHLGMLLTDATQGDLDAVSRFAIPVGIAFQIKDDLLGVYGSEKELGKPVTSDLEEGKTTHLTVFAREHATAGQRLRLTGLYGKSGLTDDDLADARNIFRECGAVTYCESRAATLVNEGKQALMGVSMPAESKIVLRQLADFVISRTT